jgi:hypothetical protein
MIKVPCLLVPFFYRECASCTLESGNHFRREASPPPAMIIATCARDPRRARQASLPIPSGNTIPPGENRRRDVDCHVQLRQSPTRTKGTNQGRRGIAPRHEFCHFVLADSGLGQGQKPVPSMERTLPKSLWIEQGHV